MAQETEILTRLSAPLLRWYDENRRVLPWREEVSAYRTWVSEIMLQQTRVAAVLPYFERFMAAFPDVAALAAAEPDRLMKLWEGLGYYSRARNLQKAAKIVTEQYGGQFPRTYDGLCALPGIGDYTAGAILSIAFGQAVPAVDGNVLRVAAQHHGERARHSGREEPPHVPRVDGGGDEPASGQANTIALMDLGATVCTPGGEPLCDACPARDFCRAHQTGRERQLPSARRRRRDGTRKRRCSCWCGNAALRCGAGRRRACSRGCGSIRMLRESSMSIRRRRSSPRGGSCRTTGCGRSAPGTFSHTSNGT